MKLTRAGYLWLLLGLYAFLPVTLALAMPIGYRVRMPYAEVVKNDEGALGGHTHVEARHP